VSFNSVHFLLGFGLYLMTMLVWGLQKSLCERQKNTHMAAFNHLPHYHEVLYRRKLLNCRLPVIVPTYPDIFYHWKRVYGLRTRLFLNDLDSQAETDGVIRALLSVEAVIAMLWEDRT